MDPSAQALTSSDNVGIVFVGSSLYGAFFVLFVISSFVLHRQSKWMKGSRNTSGNFGESVYLGLGYLVFIAATSAWILSWVIVLKPTLSRVGRLHTMEWSVPLYIQNTLGWSALYFAEWNLIFRLYVIWQKNKAVLWAAVSVTSGYLVVTIREWVIYSRSHTVSPIGVVVPVIISVCVNLIITASIIVKIWQQTRLTRAIGGSGIIARITAILVESAAIYTTWMIVYLVLYWKKLPESHVFLYGLPSVAGIATMLVNVRVGLGWAIGEEGRVTHSLHNSAFARSEEFFEDPDRTEDPYPSELYP